ncbi:hypothetical protein N2152v2_001145 [Parachlorella kessleri]
MWRISRSRQRRQQQQVAERTEQQPPIQPEEQVVDSVQHGRKAWHRLGSQHRTEQLTATSQLEETRVAQPAAEQSTPVAAEKQVGGLHLVWHEQQQQLESGAAALQKRAQQPQQERIAQAKRDQAVGAGGDSAGGRASSRGAQTSIIDFEDPGFMTGAVEAGWSHAHPNAKQRTCAPCRLVFGSHLEYLHHMCLPYHLERALEVLEACFGASADFGAPGRSAATQRHFHCWACQRSMEMEAFLEHLLGLGHLNTVCAALEQQPTPPLLLLGLPAQLMAGAAPADALAPAAVAAHASRHAWPEQGPHAGEPSTDVDLSTGAARQPAALPDMAAVLAAGSRKVQQEQQDQQQEREMAGHLSENLPAGQAVGAQGCCPTRAPHGAVPVCVNLLQPTLQGHAAAHAPLTQGQPPALPGEGAGREEAPSTLAEVEPAMAAPLAAGVAQAMPEARQLASEGADSMEARQEALAGLGEFIMDSFGPDEDARPPSLALYLTKGGAACTPPASQQQHQQQIAEQQHQQQPVHLHPDSSTDGVRACQQTEQGPQQGLTRHGQQAAGPAVSPPWHAPGDPPEAAQQDALDTEPSSPTPCRKRCSDSLGEVSGSERPSARLRHTAPCFVEGKERSAAEAPAATAPNPASAPNQDELPEASHNSQHSQHSASLPASGSPQRGAQGVAGKDSGGVVEQVSKEGGSSEEEEPQLGERSEEDEEGGGQSSGEEESEEELEDAEQEPQQQSLQQQQQPQQPGESGQLPSAEQAAVPQASPAPRRRNQRFSNAQCDSLEAVYQMASNPGKQHRAVLGASIGLTEAQVAGWFKRRRSKESKAGASLPQHPAAADGEHGAAAREDQEGAMAATEDSGSAAGDTSSESAAEENAS